MKWLHPRPGEEEAKSLLLARPLPAVTESSAPCSCKTAWCRTPRREKPPPSEDAVHSSSRLKNRGGVQSKVGGEGREGKGRGRGGRAKNRRCH